MNRAAEPGSEPLDHALGRSRGGLSTKIHQLVDGQGRPLVIALTAGQAGDSPMLKWLLSDLAVTRLGPGRPRTRPDALLGDKAYSSRANREPAAHQAGQGRHPAARRPDRPPEATRLRRRTPTLLRRRDLQGPQRRRALLQRAQAMARLGHSLRQARHHLPRRGRPTSDHDLASPIGRHARAITIWLRQ
jgi:transposase